MNFLSLFLQVISGAAAGSIIGSAFPNLGCGAHRNAIIGLVGGGTGGQILERLYAGSYSATDMKIFLCSIAGGALGGSALMLLAGVIKGIVARSRK